MSVNTLGVVIFGLYFAYSGLAHFLGAKGLMMEVAVLLMIILGNFFRMRSQESSVGLRVREWSSGFSMREVAWF